MVLFFFMNLMSHAETTINEETMMDSRRLPVYTWRSASELNQQIKQEVKYLQGLRAKAGGARYAYINKLSKYGSFTTYLVDLENNGRIIDLFPSLVGFNGIGCGYGKTRPGVTKLTKTEGQGASRKPWWGNNWKMYDIEPIKGVTQCNINSEIVAHSNTNLSGKDIDDRVTSHSSGCFTVPPDRLEQMKKYAGNAMIYNVPGNSR